MVSNGRVSNHRVADHAPPISSVAAWARSDDHESDEQDIELNMIILSNALSHDPTNQGKQEKQVKSAVTFPRQNPTVWNQTRRRLDSRHR
jgi:hypothetical protein